jgi:hypothetical protein
LSSDWLKIEGFPDHVVKGGIKRLISNWSAFVEQLTSGVDLDEDDTLNDLDGRNIIDRYLGAGQLLSDESKAQLEESDCRFLDFVVRTDQCVWSEDAAKENGWTPDHHWWYFYKLPTNP